jgi:hypothetical protein
MIDGVQNEMMKRWRAFMKTLDIEVSIGKNWMEKEEMVSNVLL